MFWIVLSLCPSALLISQVFMLYLVQSRLCVTVGLGDTVSYWVSVQPVPEASTGLTLLTVKVVTLALFLGCVFAVLVMLV